MASFKGNDLDPTLKAKLQQELKSPWRGLRRALWFTLWASAVLGLLVMASRLASGGTVALNDAFVQIGALVLCSYLLWKDRSPKPPQDPPQATSRDSATRPLN